MTGKRGEERSGIRLRIYLGEDKVQDGVPLYRLILREARARDLSGATVFRGSHGFGRSTRLHTVDVLASEDLPILVEIIGVETQLADFADWLEEFPQIGLVTWERVQLRGNRRLETEPAPEASVKSRPGSRSRSN